MCNKFVKFSFVNANFSFIYEIHCPRKKPVNNTRLPFGMMCSSLEMRVCDGGASSINIKHIEYIYIISICEIKVYLM